MQREAWIAKFPELDALAAPHRADLTARARVVVLKERARVYEPGSHADNVLLLLDGSVRVQQVSESGREIVLYRVSAGESCVLTVACLMGQNVYPAEAIAETPVSAVMIPRATFENLIAMSTDFRRFVFAAFSERLAELLHIVGDIVFARVDVRLAAKLLEMARNTREIVMTQQQLASEVGTAREVVSRVLAEFQRRGLISTHRGHIAITDRSALERFVSANASEAARDTSGVGPD